MSDACVFCEIMAGRIPATIVASDDDVVAFMDVRQANAGHVLVVTRAHINDIRDATDAQAGAVLRMVARVSRAVSMAFPNDGLTVWHSAGAGAHQEVPHLHFHVHPRLIEDGLLRVYPASPALPDRAALEALGERVRRAL